MVRERLHSHGRTQKTFACCIMTRPKMAKKEDYSGVLVYLFIAFSGLANILGRPMYYLS